MTRLCALAACVALGCARTHVDDRDLRPAADAGAAGMTPGAQPSGSGGSGRGGAGGAGGAIGTAGAAGTAGMPAAGTGAQQPQPSGTGGGGMPAVAGAAGAPTFPALDPVWDVPPPQPDIRADDPASVPVGVWIGEARENVSCGNSPRITLQITPGQNGAAPRGIMVFGEAPFPTSVVDPEQAYPIGTSRDDAFCRAGSPNEGYPYTLLSGQVSAAGRFDFRIAIAEPYVMWCELQSSYPFSGTSTDYACLPPLPDAAFGTCQSTPEQCPIDPGKFTLCVYDQPCLCFEDGCTANLHLTYRFDLHATGDTMQGVVSRLIFNEQSPTEVRLRRVQ